ncbi:type II secretion system F family protein [Occultella gossypii]|uniref:Type II secretion system F family protein n=1 Tax=Occultella gossypii TaxID=2800820 RepID=A0ABS7SB16_9MICO|nr:type II secretion system F family protein [Occultella gossypii]MBZ2197538.1 type II secretion system F family protein [Occultella gossypii]
MSLENPALTGAALGLMFGVGLCLVLWRVSARRVRLIDRVSPYLRDRPTTSRLLVTQQPITPFPTLERLLRPVVADAARLFERLGSSSVGIRGRLVRAGSSATVEQFRTEQVVWAALGLAAGLVAALVLGVARGAGIVPLTVLVLLCGIGGALARDQWLSQQVSARERRMVAEFPTVAELLALAVGAGEAPVAALDRVSRTTTGELSGEIGRTLAEVRSGIPLTQALDRMSARIALPSISRFTEGVATAVERGTPLADVLRAQAQDAREVGQRALMEEGGKREILMMIPVVFVLLPTSVLFAVFPGISVLRVGL